MSHLLDDHHRYDPQTFSPPPPPPPPPPPSSSCCRLQQPLPCTGGHRGDPQLRAAHAMRTRTAYSCSMMASMPAPRAPRRRGLVSPSSAAFCFLFFFSFCKVFCSTGSHGQMCSRCVPDVFQMMIQMIDVVIGRISQRTTGGQGQQPPGARRQRPRRAETFTRASVPSDSLFQQLQHCAAGTSSLFRPAFCGFWP